MRLSASRSRPISARSIRSFERYGMTNVVAVLTRLIASTSTRRRQYGTRKANARRSMKPSAFSLRLRARQDEQARGLVGVHLDRAQFLVGCGVVNVDGFSSLIHIEQPAVRRHAQRHARPAFKRRAVQQTALFDVERPEFIAANLLHQAVTALAISRHREAHTLGWSNRREVNAFGNEIDAAEPHDAAAVQRILNGEKAGEEAGVVIKVVDGTEVHPAEPWLERPAERPGVDLGEVRRLEDQHVIAAKKVEQLTIGREPDIDELALFAARPRNVARDLLLGEVVKLNRDVANLPTVDLLGRRAGQQNQEALERIDLQAADPDLRVALAQREGRKRLSRGDVDDLDLLERRVEHVELLARLRQGQRARDARLQLDLADHGLGALVEDLDVAGVGADVHQLVAAGHADAEARGFLCRDRPA